METKIWVRQVRVNPNTGHRTIRLQSETTDGTATWLGPLKDWGVDAETFYMRFGGEKQQLINYLVRQHKAFMGRHAGLTEELSKLEGEVIG